VSHDPEAPEILTTSTLLTQKPTAFTATPGQFTSKDLHTAHAVAKSAIFGQRFLVSLAERILTHVTAKAKMAMQETQFTRRRSGSAQKQGSCEKHVAPRTCN
jgi:hypothetical protein